MSDIGLYCEGSALEPPLLIGLTRASFSISGIVPVSYESCQITKSILAIFTFDFFNRHGGTPSGPGEAPFGIFSIVRVTSVKSKTLHPILEISDVGAQGEVLLARCPPHGDW